MKAVPGSGTCASRSRRVGVTRGRTRWTAIVLALALGVEAAPSSAAPLTVTRLGLHPEAAAQATPTGRRIATLEYAFGWLFAGYGDYGVNTGPITLRGLDPDTRAFSGPVAEVPSEAVYLFRTFGETLYAPHIDPRGGLGGYATLAASAAPGPWEDVSSIPATHVYDVLVANGATWLFGSEGLDAKVWTGSGEGPFVESLVSGPPEGAAFARFYGGFALEGRVYTQVLNVGAPALAEGSVFHDGTGWQPGPRLFPANVPYNDLYVWKPTRFAGEIVYMDTHAGITVVRSRLFRFDGRTARYALGTQATFESPDRRDFVIDFTVAGDRLFVLTLDGDVRATTDFERWVEIGRPALPDGERATSLEVAGDAMYVGSDASAVYAVTWRPQMAVPAVPVPWLVVAFVVCLGIARRGERDSRRRSVTDTD